MTTIAYKDGILAYDGQVTETDNGDDRIISQINEKCFRTRKYLVGVAGDTDLTERFLEWSKNSFNPKKKPRFKLTKNSSMEAVVIDRDGNITLYYQDLVPLFLGKEKMYAIGSGKDFAYGAMIYGSSAKDAIWVASQKDPYTGGKIRSIRFNKKRKA